MTVYLLDTNHCSFIIDKRPQIISRLNSVSQDSILSINTTVYGELMYMVEKSTYKEENLAKVNNFINKIYIFDLDKRTSKIYAEIKAKLFEKYAPEEKKHRRKFKLEQIGIKDNDLWIAATGIQHYATIVSEDGDFQTIRSVTKFTLENWML